MNLTRTGFPLSTLLLQLGTGLAEDPAGHDELLDLLGAFEDVQDLPAGIWRYGERP
ncbi:hypothetical protein [Nocardia sp. NPDC057030]|uniref:hypothetical protein n=1 Tax=unclassified Nocardia TaxID=2637762 RepID=UPI003633E8F8